MNPGGFPVLGHNVKTISSLPGLKMKQTLHCVIIFSALELELSRRANTNPTRKDVSNDLRETIVAAQHPGSPSLYSEKDSQLENVC